MKPKDKKRLESEIAENLLDDFDKFEHFAVTHWKQIVCVCVGIVIVVAVGTIATKINDSIKTKATAAIANAKTIEELDKVIADHPNNPAVNSAKLKLAMLRFEKKEYDKALSLCQSLENSTAPDEMRWRARLNSFYILEIKGEKEKAAAGFAGLGSDSLLTEAFRAEANYGAGRIYAGLKKTEKARLALRTAALARGAAAFWGGQAKTLLDRLPAPQKADTKS